MAEHLRRCSVREKELGMTPVFLAKQLGLKCCYLKWGEMEEEQTGLKEINSLV